MPEFTKKPVKFAHKGMQWNRPVDAIPETQICYGRNIRVNQQDTITQRPGLTSFASLSGSGISLVHSLSVLNNYNSDLVAFSKAYVMAGVIGGNQNAFFVGTQAGLSNGAINPIQLPPGGGIRSQLSGNPVTFVDMAPIGTNIGWKYIGDAASNFSVGYYPGDTTAGMARAVSMGMTPPIFTTSPGPGGAGPLDGDYQWIFAYRNLFTGARSNPSQPSRWRQDIPFLTLSNSTGTFPVPDTPIDPQTGVADTHIIVDIYRFGGTLQDWRYVGSSAGGLTFLDNTPDSDLLTAPGPPQVTDAATGVTRFNLFRPFVVQGNAVYGGPDIITLGLNGKWFLSSAGRFNVNWLPGSTISINDKAFSIYQVISASLLEITEDATGIVFSGFPYPWATSTGILTAGAPLAHIWGPYGIGTGGAFIFGCGGSSQVATSARVDAGTLYWTNGNDPDSTDLPNSLIVTSPSEPLRGGCIYDGTPYVWSTERMFRIYPGGIAGQFTVQEIPGGKGLWAEYSLTVQSSAVADQSITWVGKDGIYDWSSTAGLISLTDRDMYPFFPHDNQLGLDLTTIFPFITELHAVDAPSFSDANMKFHRLCWFQGDLFYDFPSNSGSHTLVFDSKNVNGWVSLDQLSNGVTPPTTSPVARGIEIAANNLLVGVGNVVLSYTGTSDAGIAIPCRLITRQDDLGDARTQKLWGDYMFDATAGLTSISITPKTDYGNSSGVPQIFATASRTQSIYSTVSSGLGTLSISFGLDITWNAASSAPILYQYELAYVPKPELTGTRATDKTDDGYLGAKYLRGLCIESDTFNNPRTILVLVDGATAATLTVTSNGQLELPFAINPIVGSEFQLRPTDGSFLWELYSVRWVWEKWPDLDVLQSNWLHLGTSKPKYIRSFSIPLSGNPGSTPSFLVTYDGANTYNTLYDANNVAALSLAAKTPAQYSFNPPIVAHQLKLTPSVALRAFYDEIVWDAEEWPELTTFYGPIENLGTSGVKYLRGFELPIETNGGAVTMRLHYDHQNGSSGSTQLQAFAPVTTDIFSKNVFPFTPITPIIAHEFQLSSDNEARFWYNEVKWDFEPWPEFSDGFSAWMNAGTPGAKFMQGCVIPMDTGGLPATFTLRYEGGSVFIGPFTTVAGQKTAVPFSFPTPFIAHEFQLIRSSNCRVWDSEIKWVWEPVPELVTNYTTQATDHDLPGYHYLFDCYIAYIGSADAPALTITTEYGSIQYILPISNGAYTRAYLQLNPQKAKWRSYSITSTGGIRLFLKDCEVRVKNWTDKGNYPSAFTSHMPFGDESRLSGARI